MSKWVSDGSVVCREIPGSRVEAHNSISGNPNYSVRLGVPRADVQTALNKILGTPETWPHATPLSNVRAVSANIVADVGEYSTDGDAQLAFNSNEQLIDFTYAPRTGVYLELGSGIDVYIEDILEPRNESKPLNPRHFIWGETTDVVPQNKDRQLSPSEAPVKYEPGDTLTHTIEGWVFDTTNLNGFVGTCNQNAYYSESLKRTFAAGTLLLKNIQLNKGFIFVSYRAPFVVSLPLIDYSGLAGPIVKFIYEYKEEGWDKFYRYDSNSNDYATGYYYIRYAQPPHDKFEPFPLADHDDWLL